MQINSLAGCTEEAQGTRKCEEFKKSPGKGKETPCKGKNGFIWTGKLKKQIAQK